MIGWLMCKLGVHDAWHGGEWQIVNVKGHPTVPDYIPLFMHTCARCDKVWFERVRRQR